MFNFVKFDYFSDSVFRGKQVHNGQKTIPKFLSGFKHFYYKKKLPWYQIGKIRHNFLLPRVIELGRQTFMPVQTLDLHRVHWITICPTRFSDLPTALKCTGLLPVSATIVSAEIKRN